ncbi:MAG TPA: ABC transporter substrate-binding protein [Gaiellaceae bacterium]|nr:ABC transporter substrate-binding protein [Gaiellaceae bacterium]
MRRRLIIALALVLLTGAAVVTATIRTDKAAAARKVTTIQFWNGFTGPDRPTVEAIVKQFNDTHPNTQVNMTIMPWDVFYQKLLPSWASGTGPELVAISDSGQIPQYANQGVLAPLDDIYSSGSLQTNTLVKAAVEADKYNGHYYGVPMTFFSILLYWNKTMFHKAGLIGPPKTWAQWQQDAVKLTLGKGSRPTQYGLALGDHQTVPVWPVLLWGNGGGVVSPDGAHSLLDTPASVQAVQQWANLIINKHISPIGLAGADADKLFLSKKAAMEVNGPWMTDGAKSAGINFGLAMVPAGPKRSVTLGGSTVLAVNAKVGPDAKAAAEAFIEYWNSKQSQITYSVGAGFPPTRTDVTASDLSKNPYVAAFSHYASLAQFYLTNVNNFSAVNGEIFEPTIQKIENSKLGSAPKILAQAAAKINADLKK